MSVLVAKTLFFLPIYYRGTFFEPLENLENRIFKKHLSKNICCYTDPDRSRKQINLVKSDRKETGG